MRTKRIIINIMSIIVPLWFAFLTFNMHPMLDIYTRLFWSSFIFVGASSMIIAFKYAFLDSFD